MRIYLSGPMSGITDNNFPEFHRWAAALRSTGFDVVSPAEIQEAGTWELCLRADLSELCTCDGIALMPGWEGSKGAHLELHVAHRLGMKVMHLPLQFDLVTHLHRQIAFSERTFGPGDRTAGVCDHIRKELREVQDDAAAGLPTLAEWVDVIILAFDGAWRSGATPEQITKAIVAKQSKNEGRKWPDWRTADPTKAIEHDRTSETMA
ncbi:dATP/dGTP pyrophosphohydrolase domain-containing protein [Hydrogenophaga taeniospiralis]|uniref:dATP/dGTP pyrophosphohydrolase domain-containing protein n=1 Tax=Hydrogenophaga taeniospiralis TaxID=65656 RepID=UPI001CFB82EA|nr:dATP/dGTP pyrophosphohydrolase domain-containing protein [Hydrogenophaga taeniospiralis]